MIKKDSAEDKNEWRQQKSRWHYVDPSQRKVKDPKKAIKNIFVYFKKYIPFFSIAVFCAIASSILALIGPSYLSDMTDLIVEWLWAEIDLDWIIHIWIILAILYLLSWLLSITQWFVTATLTAKMSLHLRRDIIKKLNSLPIKFYDKNTTWDILSRITNDVFLLTNNLNNSLTTLIISFIMLFWSLCMMIYTNLILTLTAITTVIIWAAIIFFLMQRSQTHYDNQQAYLWKINGHVEEAFSGHSVIKAYNAEDELKERFVELNWALKHSTFMAEFISWIAMPIVIFIENFWYVVIAVIWALLAFNWDIKFWVIVAFLVYIRYFSDPLIRISWLSQRIQVAAAAAERIFSFLWERELDDESKKGKNNLFSKGEVVFEHVKFWYDKKKTIIHDLSFTAKAWDKVAIVWPTWAWKTTIVNLLMRFHEINDGKITIDWINTKDMTREYIHSLFCMVLQDTWVFDWTIRENIAYNKEDATEEEIIKASKAVWLHHFVTTLPKWYDTILDEKVSLSTWQKQQLTIARAMVYNAPMLILDEATSSIDTRTEQYIQDAMDKLMENRTSFVIAHRLSTIKNADLILVLKDWDIIESWNHDELIKKNGFYKDLYESQFSEE